MKILLTFIISVVSLGFTFVEADKKLWELTPNEFFNSAAVKKEIDLNAPDNYLLSIAVFQATNELRAKKKLSPFKPNRTLHLAGLTHVNEMRKYNFFGHINPYNNKEKTMMQRIENKEGNFRMVAENLALLPALNAKTIQYKYIKQGRKYKFYNLDGSQILPHTYESFAKDVVNEWYASKGHRENLLKKDLTYIGIAVYIEPFNYTSYEMPSVYAAQEFGGY